MTTTENNKMIDGCQIQWDRSGVGHNWKDIEATELPANVREEIEYEIYDNRQTTCPDYRATNGQHYRW